MTTEFDKIRDELATPQCQQIIKEQRAQKKDQFLYKDLSDELFWKCGFDAAVKLCREEIESRCQAYDKLDDVNIKLNEENNRLRRELEKIAIEDEDE